MSKNMGADGKIYTIHLYSILSGYLNNKKVKVALYMFLNYDWK